MELLLPMAAKKLDLSFNIDRDVPACMLAPFHQNAPDLSIQGCKPIILGFVRVGALFFWQFQFLIFNSLDESHWKCREVHPPWVSEGALLSR
jgi:hypothetical protein